MKKSLKGFTLLELLVTLAIVAVLSALAAPLFTTMIANNRAETITQELANALSLARAEAIKRGTRVSICGSSSSTSCTGSWNSGWLVFTDNVTSDIGAPVVGTGIQFYEAKSGASVSVVKGSTAQSYIRFTGQGLRARASGDTSEVDLTVRSTGCNKAGLLKVGVAGRLSRATGVCS